MQQLNKFVISGHESNICKFNPLFMASIRHPNSERKFHNVIILYSLITNPNDHCVPI